MNEAQSPDKPNFTELDAILLEIAGEYYYEGTLSSTWEDNMDSLLPYKEKIMKLLINLLHEKGELNVQLLESL